MTHSFSINGRKIGAQNPPYIIAEMSANHNGDINNAFAIIDMAADAGADAVKLQTYKPDTITLKSNAPEFQIKGGLWDGRTLYELYEGAHTPWEWHAPLFEHAKKAGITIFSSPFDETAINLLEDLNAPAYKIASFEATDTPLIKRVAATGKPLIISTGMADLGEIKQALKAAENTCSVALLHCVSGYPSPAGEYNLKTIKDMADKFNVPVGLSDHTLCNATAIASVALGACIIEKHVTLDKSRGGADDAFSIESSELKALVRDTKTAWEALGEVSYTKTKSEAANVQFRRSLYFVRDIKKGQTITKSDVRSVRPGFGLAPKHINEVIGQKAACDIKANTKTFWGALAK